MPDLKIHDVSKYYGNVKALKNASLHIEDGEYVVLLGPSGCGKTTLLKIIAGIIEPSSGKVSIGGRDVTTLAPEDRHIGFVFQNYALFPHMSVLDNASYGMMARGEMPDKARRIATKMLSIVHLDTRLDALPRELSGGMQQRLAVGRALATGSKLLLLDEPTNALDAYLRVELRNELRKISKQFGVTAIHVTHDQEEAMAIADKIVVLKNGSILQVGTPAEVYDHPASPFIANFLGEANFFYVMFENGRGKLLGRSIRRKLEGEHIAVIRPENLTLGSSGFPVKITSRTKLGPFYKYEIWAEDKTIKVRSHRDCSKATHVQFDPSRVLFFPVPPEGLEKSLQAVG